MTEVKINPKLIAIYDEAAEFVKYAFPDAKDTQLRISVLSIMKMIIDIEKTEPPVISMPILQLLEQELKKVFNSEEFVKKQLALKEKAERAG